jgi:hypothetical protein
MAKSRNPVAKFSRRFNKAVTMVDRKREEKKTHKKQTLEELKMVDSDG